jgi:2-polyprenyl-3-methyl-5-hydroxy-6-metoxy-1,4-benzoquinol methylase
MSQAASISEFLRDGPHNGPRIAHVSSKGGLSPAGEHDIIDCFTCGFRHVLPLPDPAALEREYRENYYSEEKPNFIAHAGEDQAWFELAQNDRLAIFEKLLPPASSSEAVGPKNTRRKLLDIGCGPGFFLKTAIARGWQGHGIEPSKQAAAHARSLGATVTEGFFNWDSAQRLGRYDVVNLTNVLEHVPDAAQTLSRASNLLEPGGVLCVGVPNDFSLFQIAARTVADTGDWWLAPPHHLNYFDFDSLEGAIEKLGLKLVERTTSFPMEAFVMMGDNYVGDPTLGRACHTKRKNFDFAFEKAGLTATRRDFYRAMARLGIGREAVVIAVKP